MNYKLLKESVEMSDLTKTNIAEQLQISRNTLDAILNGQTDPRVSHIEKLAALLNIEVTAFFDGRTGNVTAVGTHAKAAGRDLNLGTNTRMALRIAKLEGELATAKSLAQERKEMLDTLRPLVQHLSQQNAPK